MSDKMDKNLGCLFMVICIVCLAIWTEYLSYETCKENAKIRNVEYTWGPICGCDLKEKKR